MLHEARLKCAVAWQLAEQQVHVWKFAVTSARIKGSLGCHPTWFTYCTKQHTRQNIIHPWWSTFRFSFCSHCSLFFPYARFCNYFIGISEEIFRPGFKAPVEGLSWGVVCKCCYKFYFTEKIKILLFSHCESCFKTLSSDTCMNLPQNSRIYRSVCKLRM